MYVVYDPDTMYSTGCSSSIPTEPYIEVDSVDEKFYGLFECYKVDIETKELTFDDVKYNEYINAKYNTLTPIQELAQENTQLQIELIELKNALMKDINYLNIENNSKYWYDRFDKKYASIEQINRLIELGIVQEREV